MKLQKDDNARFLDFEAVWADDHCIYLLLDNEEVVYVGRTTNLWLRLQSYSHKRKKYNRVLFLPTSATEFGEAEKFFIRKYRPEYNKCRVKKSAPHIPCG